MYRYLSLLRIYPWDYILSEHAAENTAVTCWCCHRPIRLFSSALRGPWSRHNCSVRRWKGRNPDVARIFAYHLWPQELNVDFQPAVLSFLCHEDIQLLQGAPGQQPKILTPITRSIMSEVHARVWHSLLLKGVKRACCQFSYVYLPLARPKTSESEGQDVGGIMRSRAEERWAIFVQLWKNLLWRLALACHHHATWSQTSASKLTAGRPLDIMLGFLGAASSGGGGRSSPVRSV